MKSDKILQLLIWFVILTALGLMLTAIFWLTHPYNPIEFKDKVLPVLNEKKQVKSGDYLLISLDYCKSTNEIPLVTRTFADGILYDTPIAPVSYKGTGCGKIVVQVYVPKALPVGIYTLKNSYIYQVNPIRKLEVHIDTEQFTIVK